MNPRHALSSHSEFTRRIIVAVRRIPSGRVATYGDIADLAGCPNVARAVGTVMRNCRTPGVPCHRVVAAGGRLGGYSDPWVKTGLLRADGVRVVGGQLRDFTVVRWHGRARLAMTNPLS
jgi:methylated-DNA-protein-cysteine methyltransferase-like protein